MIMVLGGLLILLLGYIFLLWRFATNGTSELAASIMLILGIVFSTQLSHFYSIPKILPLAEIFMCRVVKHMSKYEYLESHQPSTPMG